MSSLLNVLLAGRVQLEEADHGGHSLDGGIVGPVPLLSLCFMDAIC